MIRFLHRNHHSLLFDVPFLQYPCLRFISTTSESIDDKTCFTTRDYLINSCGLSPEKALSAAQKIRLKPTSKPDSVLNLFKTHGFSKTQITQIISKRPVMLLCCPEKTLKPKINFLNQLGVTDPQLANLISSDPSVLIRGLENQIIPSIEYLKCFLGSNRNVITAFKRSTWVLSNNLERLMGPNVAILRNLGVPKDNISKMLLYCPRALTMNTNRFNEAVGLLKEMGFNPLSMMFVYGLRVMLQMTKINWERKFDLYKELGWSEEEVLIMFRKQPTCMLVSEEKIKTTVDFFFNTLKWKPMKLSLNLVVFTLSMEKRIIPRCAVLEFLKSQGVLRKFSEAHALTMTEKLFLTKYVHRYQEKVPDVVKVYEGQFG